MMYLCGVHRYAQQFAADAAKLLQRVPRALLLLLKTNDCLRSVDASLGQVRKLISILLQGQAERCSCYGLLLPH